MQIEIVLGKTEKFDELMAAEAEQNGDNEEQQNWLFPNLFSSWLLKLFQSILHSAVGFSMAFNLIFWKVKKKKKQHGLL